MSKASTGALAEVQTAAQKIAASFKQEVVIQKYQLSQDEMVDFIEHVKAEKVKDSKITISLTDYITDKFYSKQKNIVVVPDLSGLTIGKKCNMTR